jgi:hypothetical protein
MGGAILLPDGSDRFLVDEKMLMDATEHLHGQLLDPSKRPSSDQLLQRIRDRISGIGKQ